MLWMSTCIYSQKIKIDRKKERKMGLKPTVVAFAAMVMVECLDVGLTTLSKAAMSKGMNHFVFVVYSNSLATLILLPSSLIFHRTSRPPLTFSLLCENFLLGLIGITVTQNCVFTGVNYSSPTLASAMSNLIPAFTFLLAVLFRMEKINLRSSRSQIKIMATLVSISGAMVVTLYKGGPAIRSLLMQSISFSNMLTAKNNWIIGGLFLAIASLSVSIWNTFQAAILKGYPSELTIVAFYCLFGTIQCTLVSLIAERPPKCLENRFWDRANRYHLLRKYKHGVYVRTALFFCPFGVIFLGETLHLGSVVGATLIVPGFYGVMWGQSIEDTENAGMHAAAAAADHERQLPTSSRNTPLLMQNHRATETVL